MDATGIQDMTVPSKDHADVDLPISPSDSAPNEGQCKIDRVLNIILVFRC